ncbi:hypothetical protein AWR27_14830 [Spirosoma montaniterrae]|uniref:Uncharacterized protein n=1 Tax=Spirosoma montaniterrae TaxID=1178516 RepID=A0A1P9WYM1_9BACT|nr:hypothetical protein AWR27_14830 [Spirosoma montaniterrae]
MAGAKETQRVMADAETQRVMADAKETQRVASLRPPDGICRDATLCVSFAPASHTPAIRQINVNRV